MRCLSTRYSDPEILKHYSSGLTVDELARRMKRDERTVRNWLSGRQKVPFWVPELLRLQRLERHYMLQYMGVNNYLGKLGIVRGEKIEYPRIIKKIDENPENRAVERLIINSTDKPMSA